MSSLKALKKALRQDAHNPADEQSISEEQYRDGFNILCRGLGWIIYREFIVPQLTQQLFNLLQRRPRISILEIGPGPRSILHEVPQELRRKIHKYVAFEPNHLFATAVEATISTVATADPLLPGLEAPQHARIHREPFQLEQSAADMSALDLEHPYDMVLFCHSMYGMAPKRKFIEKGLGLLSCGNGGNGMVLVFHREGLYLDGLVPHRTASFPTGLVQVSDTDKDLTDLSALVAGFRVQSDERQVGWRKLCRDLGRREDGYPGELLFDAPNVMVAFTRHATTALDELSAQVPLVEGTMKIKNRQARQRQPAAIVRPTEVQHVQNCVRWALDHRTSLTVIGGGHSGHGVETNVVAVDMGSFNKIQILPVGSCNGGPNIQPGFLAVVGGGCKTGDIMRETMASGWTVPLGSRPSVGAGLWLQGGIGHLSRSLGLACDAIIGVVLVSVATCEVLCVGTVPADHCPPGARRPDKEAELLWALKGAGANFGIVISVTFKLFPARKFRVRNLMATPGHSANATADILNFIASISSTMAVDSSADLYLFCEGDQLRVGVTAIDNFLTSGSPSCVPAKPSSLEQSWQASETKTVDGVELFDEELYMSTMHGGHGGGTTSAFKRCVFLKHLDRPEMVERLVESFKSRPTNLCYFHFLHGGGEVGSAEKNAASSFGCRDWDFACVITGVWPRRLDDTDTERAVVRWVYGSAKHLLPLAAGVYGADLGPDPRDVPLAARSFGQDNRRRLAKLKSVWDPHGVLRYVTPAAAGPKIIFLITGESFAGKDHCADIFLSGILLARGHTAHLVSISDKAKKEYAAASGAELRRLLTDRKYKEEHREKLTEFYRRQVANCPEFPQQHLLQVVREAANVDALLITGMRDKAPVAKVAHLVPSSRVFEIRVEASEETRRTRGAACTNHIYNKPDAASEWTPDLTFRNDAPGSEAASAFAKNRILPLFGLLTETENHLRDLVRSTPGFPQAGIEFRDVIGIVERPGGLDLCTDLMERHFLGRWAEVDVVAGCEAGGFVFALPLAARVGRRPCLLHKAGRLPPEVALSTAMTPSHISSVAAAGLKPPGGGSDKGEVVGGVEERRNTTTTGLEMRRDPALEGARVLVVDDVLASGETLCAVLRLLGKAGVVHIDVMVVAEFASHGGRGLLLERGFGNVRIQSLLVFEGH